MVSSVVAQAPVVNRAHDARATSNPGNEKAPKPLLRRLDYCCEAGEDQLAFRLLATALPLSGGLALFCLRNRYADAP